MSTVAEIIRDALGYLRVLDANEAAEAEDATTAMRMLNLMMHSWQANNLALAGTRLQTQRISFLRQNRQKLLLPAILPYCWLHGMAHH